MNGHDDGSQRVVPFRVAEAVVVSAGAGLSNQPDDAALKRSGLPRRVATVVLPILGSPSLAVDRSSRASRGVGEVPTRVEGTVDVVRMQMETTTGETHHGEAK